MDVNGRMGGGDEERGGNDRSERNRRRCLERDDWVSPLRYNLENIHRMADREKHISVIMSIII